MDGVKVEQVLEQLVKCLSLLGNEPTVDTTFKEVGGEIYSTSTVNCKSASGNTVQLFKKTELVPEPLKVKEELDKREASLSEQLQMVQDKKAVVFPELDKVLPTNNN